MYLSQRDCSWNTVSTYIKTVRSVYHRSCGFTVHPVYSRLFEHVYTGTKSRREKSFRSIRHQEPGSETEMDLYPKGFLPKRQQKTKFTICFHVYDAWSPICRFSYLHKKDLQGNILSAIVEEKLVTR